MKQRQYRYDNIRYFLILLVVFGHMLTGFKAGIGAKIYKVIFTFHMPAFLYIVGKFARFDKRKILKHLALPYAVFQVLYLAFQAWVIDGKTLTLQFTTPYWIMWFLFASLLYHLILPMLPEKGTDASYYVLAGSVFLSLLVGFDKAIGGYMALSRTLVFAPFFLWGYYGPDLRSLPGRWRIPVSLAVIIVGECYVLKTRVPDALLLGNACYAAAKSTVFARFMVLLTAAGWIAFLEAVIPEKQIPFATACGQNTLPIYLLHGFVIRLLTKYDVFCLSQGWNIAFACFFTLALTAFFGNPLVGKLFKKLF